MEISLAEEHLIFFSLKMRWKWPGNGSKRKKQSGRRHVRDLNFPTQSKRDSGRFGGKSSRALLGGDRGEPNQI